MGTKIIEPLTGHIVHDDVGLIIEESKRFNEFLGGFILSFAKIESMLYKVLLHYANISDAVGRSILSGTRVGGLIQYIRAIAANTDMDEKRKQDLEVVFGRLESINGMRDELIHRARPGYSPSGALISNIERVSRYANQKSFRVSSWTIQAMESDLSRIGIHLSFHLRPGDFRPPPKKMLHAWLYKSPQQAKKSSKNRQASRKQRAPRSSSPR